MPEERLSFCMVTTFYPPYHFGGDAIYAYRLSNALARRGHKVTVVHSADAYRALRRIRPRTVRASGRRDTPSARAVSSEDGGSCLLSLWAASVLRVRACFDISSRALRCHPLP